MQLDSDYYDTDFELTYKGNKILIRNDGPEGESLFINGVLQDQNFSARNGKLIGHIFDEENNKEVIEVILGGSQTQDCMVYVNGSQIHSLVPHVEHIEAHEQQNVKEKKRSNLFFPFLMIMLIAVCMIVLLPYMKNADSAEPPSDPVFQEDTGASPEYIEVNYSWNYGDGTWIYDLKIPKSAYEYYKTVDRKKIKNYSYYVTDTGDDEYLAGLAEKFKETAEKE
ncbi:MAG TPA: hypothetical protein VM577_19790, partial [Anaerovoracaceae bacterium]|nr:hypothetical protein [Anaerovoracaceae bacterium]